MDNTKIEKVIIAGSRHLGGMNLVPLAMDAFIRTYGKVSEILSGGCRGIDKEGEDWARKVDQGCSYSVFKAEWNKHGKSAGPIRNQAMVDQADALVAIWDGFSRGTMDVINRASIKGIPVMVLRIEEKGWHIEHI